jgi:hypothetical protein
MAKGEEDKTDWGAYAKSTIDNIAPVNPMENYIGSAAVRILGGNQRWTGQKIENEEDEKKPVGKGMMKKPPRSGNLSATGWGWRTWAYLQRR